MTEPHLSDSTAWREAETFMIEWLRGEHGIDLKQGEKLVFDGVSVEVDGISLDPPVLCEVYGRLGAVAGTTMAKVSQDAFKMVWLRDTYMPDARVIVLIANRDLERRFTEGKGWRPAMFRANRVEVICAELTDEQRTSLVEATGRAQKGIIPPSA